MYFVNLFKLPEFQNLFSATVVQTRDIYWVMQQSPLITISATFGKLQTTSQNAKTTSGTLLACSDGKFYILSFTVLVLIRKVF